MVYDRLRSAHEPIGVYADDAYELSAELHAYANELERLYDTLDAILPERFILTAGDRGLSAYEELFGPALAGEDIDVRRERLIRRLTIGGTDFTLSGICRALDSFGLRYTVAQFPHYYRLNIIADTDYTKAQQAFIRREVEKIIPPHIDFQLVFNTLSWDELDARDKQFASLDNDNLKWAQIDALTRQP